MERIMVVEDEPAILLVLREVFQTVGYEVTTASDSDAALELLRLQDPPDLAVVDLFIPGVGGAAILATMRQTPALADVPVVIITGAVPRAEILPPRSSYQALVGKPFDLNDLLQTVSALLPSA